MVTEHIYKELFELSPDGVVLIDPETSLPIEFNKAAHENLGYTRDEFFRLRISDYEAKESSEEVQKHIQKIIKTGIDNFETLHRTKTGELRNFLVTVKRVEFQEKMVFLCYFRDITETKQAQKQAVEFYERLEKIASQVPGVVYQYKVDADGKGSFPYASAGMKVVYGVDPEQVREDASAVMEVIDPRDTQGVVDSIQESAGTLKPWKTEYRVTHKDGTRKWLMGSAIPQRDEHGSTLWHGFIADISEQKKVQEELEIKTAELEGFFNVSLDLLCIADMQGKFHKLNKSWEEVLGYDLDEIRQKKFMDFIHPEDKEKTIQQMALLKENKNVINFVNRFRKKDGTYCYIEWRSHPHGNLIYAAARDITERIETEEALRIKEQRFRDISQAAGEYIWETNVDGIYVFVTERASQVLKRPVDEIIGSSPFDFIPEEDSQNVMNFFLDKAEKGESFSGLEHRSMLPDGSFIWQRVTGVPVFDSEGLLIGYRGAAMDITLEKEARLSLLENEQKFRGLFEMSPVGIGLNDFATGQWLDFNHSLLESTGYTKEEFRELSYWDLTPREYEQQEAKQLESLEKTGYFGPYEKEYIRKDGQRYPVLLNGMLITDKSGKKMIWCIIQDITERKEFEEAILRKEKEIRSMTQASLDALIVIDSKGRVTFWNKAAHNLFGYSEEEAIGKDVHDLVALEADRIKAQQGIREFAGSGLGKVVDNIMEFQARTRQGKIIDVERSVASFELDGEWHAVGSVRDISDRIRARVAMEQARTAAEDANRAKSDFLANMSHEIRTPMNAIIGLSQLALNTELSPKQRDYLEKIETSSRMLLGVINDVLDFSKIEAGRLELEHHEFDLESLLDQVAVLFINSTESKGLELFFRVHPDVPRVVVGDSLRIKQVLTNLMSNAVKFTHEGQIEIKVNLVSRDNEQAILRFAVCDTGIGISSEEQQKLFKAFSQADTSTTRKYGGTGLGLIISQRLVEIMGGNIEVKSEPGQGSVFSFNALFKVGQESEGRFDSCSLDECRALIVEKNETSQIILREILESWNFSTKAAADGRQALKLVSDALSQGRVFDVILVDMNIQGISGPETIRLIRDKELSWGVRPQVCMLLAPSGRKEEAESYLSLNRIDNVLLKPLTSSTLFDAIMSARGEVKDAQKPSTIFFPDYYLQGLSILVVEDNEINQQVAREILEQAGISVQVAENGKVAVDAVDDHNFDIVLMDIQMPEMDGFEATRVIKSKYPDLPVVAMTAAAMESDRQKSLAAGMDEHLGKPINQKILFQTIEKFISSKIHDDRAASYNAQNLKGGFPLQLPGLDVQSGLSRLGGNTSLYSRLLKDTVRDFAGTPEKLKHYLDSHNKSDAEALIHTLKGIAGNISATKLYERCSRMVEDIRQDRNITVNDLKYLQSALDELKESVLLLKRREKNDRLKEFLPVEELLPRIDEFRQLLMKNSLDAQDYVKYFKNYAGSEYYAEIVQDLMKSMSVFDFREAEKILARLEVHLQQNMDNQV